MHPFGKNVWVTGASSGIGRAMAVEAARLGGRLILSARRRDRLEETAEACRALGAEALALPLDLGDSASIAAAVREAGERRGGIDMLVNAGGIGQRGLAMETRPEVGRRIFDVDFWGAVELTLAVVPGMAERGAGQVAVVTSVQGKFGMARRAYYAAAKHALHGWFDSLREELAGSGVKITLVVPGWVRTEISEQALEANGAPHGTMDSGQMGGISPEECARRSFPAIIKERPELLVGGMECAGVYLNRLSPALFRRVLRRRKA